MITGREFTAETIHEKEVKCLKEFYSGDNPVLVDGIAYYEILFRQFLYLNADKKFERLEEAEQDRIINKELNEFEAAMRYSFNKGHQTAFLVLLMSTKNNQGYEPDYFKQPNSLNNFLYTFDKTINSDVFDNNISRDANDTLINYTRRNFENGYTAVMFFGKIFFKKGAGVAFEQIRKQVVGVDYEITGYSKMLNVPYNAEFDVTPAFKAQFSLETPGFEEWDIFWDATYEAKYSNNLIAKCLIHQMTPKNIKDYAAFDAATYKTLLDHNMGTNLKDNEILYLVEINFSLFNPSDTVRLLEKAEYDAVKISLATTISRKLQVDRSHIFILD